MVTSSSSESPAASTARFLPRLVGSAQAIVGIGLAVAVAGGVNDLAHRRVVSGLWILAGALALRWLDEWSVDEWASHAARVIRSRWRSRMLGHLERPRAEGEGSRGDLALAIERASGEPALLVLRSSAQAAALGLVVVFAAAGWLPTAILVALILLAVPLYRRSGHRSAALELEYSQRRALLEQRQLELLRHSPELRALGAVDYGADEIAAISDSEHAIALRAIRVALGSSLVTEFLSGVSIGLVAMVVGFALLDGRLSLVRGLVAVLVTSELFVHVRRYGVEFHRREQAAHSLDLLSGVTEAPARPEGSDLLEARDLVTAASATPVSLDVRASTRTLVVGASGAGKTTLLHTLLGWREPRSGSVRRRDTPMAYVSAESAFLSGSLWENLTLGQDIEPQRVEGVLARLGLDGPRFADLSAPLLADGRGLSGGERVRLALARSLLAEPELLMIDDVGGVLDPVARRCVVSALADYPALAVLEAAIDAPLLDNPDRRIEVR